MPAETPSARTKKSGATEAPPTPEPAEGLTRSEREEVREGGRHRAAVVYDIIRVEGETELCRPASALWWSGIAAGISIGLSFVTEAALAAHLPDAPWADLVASLGYSVGFLVVILGHQQLFTENVLTAVLPVISRSSLTWVLRLLRLWGIVLAANVVGCAIFATFFATMPVVGAEVVKEMEHIVVTMMSGTPLEMFTRGIGSGWMIAALVWLMSASETGHAFMITVLTSLIAVFGFTHIVAGTAEAIYGLEVGLIGWDKAVFGFFLPVLAGNVFGGTVLFSTLSYAQVSEEIKVDETDNRSA